LKNRYEVEINQMNVVVVSPPGRKRENLLSMLESIDRLESIETVDTCNDFISNTDLKDPVTVLIDYRYPELQLEKQVSELIMNNAIDHVVLMQARNAPKSHFTHYTTSEVVFEDLSVEILKNLLRTIQFKTDDRYL
jgi:hypothetical protein